MFSIKMINLLKKHEGLRLTPYKCTANKLTIGYGRNIEDVGISVEEAEILLKNDIESRDKELMRFRWYQHLDPIRKEVIINMSFMGTSKILRFSKMIKAIENGDYKKASEEMLNSKWSKDVGNRSIELAKIMMDGRL